MREVGVARPGTAQREAAERRAEEERLRYLGVLLGNESPSHPLDAAIAEGPVRLHRAPSGNGTARGRHDSHHRTPGSGGRTPAQIIAEWRELEQAMDADAFEDPVPELEDRRRALSVELAAAMDARWDEAAVLASPRQDRPR